jgi:hypothetical protein
MGNAQLREVDFTRVPLAYLNPVPGPDGHALKAVI